MTDDQNGVAVVHDLLYWITQGEGAGHLPNNPYSYPAIKTALKWLAVKRGMPESAYLDAADKPKAVEQNRP